MNSDSELKRHRPYKVKVDAPPVLGRGRRGRGGEVLDDDVVRTVAGLSDPRELFDGLSPEEVRKRTRGMSDLERLALAAAPAMSRIQEASYDFDRDKARAFLLGCIDAAQDHEAHWDVPLDVMARRSDWADDSWLNRRDSQPKVESTVEVPLPEEVLGPLGEWIAKDSSVEDRTEMMAFQSTSFRTCMAGRAPSLEGLDGLIEDPTVASAFASREDLRPGDRIAVTRRGFDGAGEPRFGRRSPWAFWEDSFHQALKEGIELPEEFVERVIQSELRSSAVSIVRDYRHLTKKQFDLAFRRHALLRAWGLKVFLEHEHCTEAVAHAAATGIAHADESEFRYFMNAKVPESTARMVASAILAGGDKNDWRKAAVLSWLPEDALLAQAKTTTDGAFRARLAENPVARKNPEIRRELMKSRAMDVHRYLLDDHDPGTYQVSLGILIEKDAWIHISEHLDGPGFPTAFAIPSDMMAQILGSPVRHVRKQAMDALGSVALEGDDVAVPGQEQGRVAPVSRPKRSGP